MDKSDLEQVTVVCVTHQSRTLLDAMTQTLLPLPKVIVIDNASSDGMAAALRERIPHATVLECRSNSGFGSANNEAMIAYGLIREGAERQVILKDAEGAKIVAIGDRL